MGTGLTVPLSHCPGVPPPKMEETIVVEAVVKNYHRTCQTTEKTENEFGQVQRGASRFSEISGIALSLGQMRLF